jgi:hypothetical protein
MRSFALKPIAAWLLVAIGGSAFAEDHQVTIKNTSGTTANDLHLVFKGAVSNVNFVRSDGTPVAPGTVNATMADWNTSQLGDTVGGSGGSAKVTYAGPANAGLLDTTMSYWTASGTILDHSLANLGATPSMSFVGNNAFATFLDPENFGVTYSNIALYLNNNLANFGNVGLEFIPTGTFVTGLPTSIMLDPGQSLTLSYGQVNPSLGYELALANVAATNNPTNLFAVASAAIVPEPSSLVLVGTAAVILLGYWGAGQVHLRRRRQKAAFNEMLGPAIDLSRFDPDPLTRPRRNADEVPRHRPGNCERRSIPR